ncbi:MAG: hypothetical protein KGH68_02820 [Patescibacteria group bacterium]|nr:hypothetical protein [Patescibacteria group bacterium]
MAAVLISLFESPGMTDELDDTERDHLRQMRVDCEAYIRQQGGSSNDLPESLVWLLKKLEVIAPFPDEKM